MYLMILIEATQTVVVDIINAKGYMPEAIVCIWKYTLNILHLQHQTIYFISQMHSIAIHL